MSDIQEKYKNRFPVPSCGKCDFRDTVTMIHCDGTDETVIPFFKKSKIYVRDIGPIKMETYQDFIPYMHFIANEPEKCLVFSQTYEWLIVFSI